MSIRGRLEGGLISMGGCRWVSEEVGGLGVGGGGGGGGGGVTVNCAASLSPN